MTTGSGGDDPPKDSPKALASLPPPPESQSAIRSSGAGAVTAGAGAVTLGLEGESPEVRAFVEEAIRNKPEPIARFVTAQLLHHQGPLPTPAFLAQYEKAIPGTGKAIVEAFQKETEHRHAMDMREFEHVADVARQKQGNVARGQWFAFLVAIVFVAAGTLLVLRGHGTEGTFLGGGTLVALVLAFLGSRAAAPKKNGQPPTIPNPPPRISLPPAPKPNQPTSKRNRRRHGR